MIAYSAAAHPPAFTKAALASALALCGLLNIEARADWLHYRGPHMNGSSTEKLPAALNKQGPAPLWKASLGTGSSAISVANGRVFSMGNVHEKDTVYCLDANSGKEIWRHEYTLGVDKRMFEGGPATTPTLDAKRVYTVSHQGDLFCLDADTGKPIWYKHYQKDFGGTRPQWGYAGSPTVEGKLLLIDVGAKGGSTVALDKTTGNTVWKSGDDAAGYGSPVVATVAGQRTVLVFKANALVGLDLKDGHELWRAPWKTNYDVNAATPIVFEDKVFITSGYDTGCALLAITPGKAAELWRNKNLRAHINTPVYWQGHIYGLDGQAEPGAPLVCLDAATGKKLWSEKNLGGSLIAVDGQLVILSERGELLIGDASPSAFKASIRTQVLGGRCWVQPTVSEGKLFVKNNEGELVCLDLSSK